MFAFAWTLVLAVFYVQSPTVVGQTSRQQTPTRASSQRDDLPSASPKELTQSISKLTAERIERPPLEAIKLYQQARNLLGSESPHLAVPVLQQLAESHPNTALAAIGLVRIAEFQLTDKQPVQALQTLIQLISSPAVRMEEISKIDASFPVRVHQLIQHSVSVQTEEEFNAGCRWLSESLSSPSQPSRNNDPNSVTNYVHQELIQQAVYRLARDKRFGEALQLLTISRSTLDAELQRSLDLDFPLAMLRSNPTDEQTAWVATHLIDSRNTNTESQNVALKIALAEAYRSRGNLEQAATLFGELAEQLQQYSTTQAIAANAPIEELVLKEPNPSLKAEIASWQSTVHLRVVEIHVLQKEFSKALDAAGRALSQFPNSSLANQFRFLMARCHIAQVDFDAARQQLHFVMQRNESEQSGDDLSNFRRQSELAQALWMLGEVAFLQQDYAVALTHFQQVLGVHTTTAWHPRALWEAGKCHEMLGAPLDAIVKYQIVVSQYPESEVAKLASSRLRQLMGKSDSQRDQASQTPTIISR